MLVLLKSKGKLNLLGNKLKDQEREDNLLENKELPKSLHFRRNLIG